MSPHKFFMNNVAVAFFMSAVLFIPFVHAADEEVMTWDECVRETSKNHPDLISAVEGVKASEAARSVSASAEYPQVTASASGSTSKSTGQVRSESYTTSLSGSQLVFDGKKTINAVKAAGETVRASQQNYRYASAEVRKSLRAAFVNLLKAQEMTRIAQEIFEIRRGSLELITLRYESGLEHKGALLTAEANLAQARYSVNSSLHDLRVSQSNLAKELGRQSWAALRVTGDFSVQDVPGGDIDLQEIAARNPEVLGLTARKNAAEFNLRSSYGNYAPSLSLDASLGKTGTTFLPQNTQKSVGLSLSMPLLEGGLRAAQIAQAQANLNQLRADETGKKNTVIASLEQYRAAVLEAIDNVGVQQKSLSAAEERSRIAEAQYSIGTISFDSWTIIEDNLVSAKRAYLYAQAEALLSEADWIQAKGETLEYGQ